MRYDDAYAMVMEEIGYGGYDLADMLLKIDRLWLEDAIDASYRDQLKDAAREHANPEDSYASPQERLTALETALRALETRVAALEGAGGSESAGNADVAEWKQPTGAHDAYAKGDRVTFGGKVWESTIDGNVWSPAVYPAGWTEVGE